MVRDLPRKFQVLHLNIYYIYLHLYNTQNVFSIQFVSIKKKVGRFQNEKPINFIQYFPTMSPGKTFQNISYFGFFTSLHIDLDNYLLFIVVFVLRFHKLLKHSRMSQICSFLSQFIFEQSRHSFVVFLQESK